MRFAIGILAQYFAAFLLTIGGIVMDHQIATKGIHHLTLTVTNVGRAQEFYTGLLNFQPIMEFGSRILLSNGSIVLVLTPASDPSQAMSNDSFDENRVGLDHVSFSVGSRDELEAAVRLFDDQGVPHGEIKDLGPGLGLYVLAFRDPDNIQLELSAPYS
jgi:catechol 2,3-dioxygenase-like lactoylglutathione lyase family enzyme